MSQTCKVRLSTSVEMLGTYVNEILASTAVNLRDEEDTTEDEDADTLLDLLEAYAKRMGIKSVRDPNTKKFSIPGILDPDGISEKAMGAVPGLYLSHARETAERGATYNDKRKQFEKCVLAIPGEVAQQIWGEGVNRAIYVTVSVDPNTPVEITDPNLVPKDAKGRPIRQYKKEINVGGYIGNDDPRYMNVVNEVLKNSGERAMRSYWNRVILERLKAAASNPNFLGLQLQNAYQAKERADNSAFFSQLKNIRIIPGQRTSECDFTATIVGEYVWTPRKQEGAIKQAPNVGVAPTTPKSSPNVAPEFGPGQKVKI